MNGLFAADIPLVLIGSRRRRYTVNQIWHALGCGFQNILVWDNSEDQVDLERFLRGSCRALSAYCRIHVMSFGRDIGVVGRYMAASAQTGPVAVQDSDVQISANDWRRLFDSYDGRSIVSLSPPQGYALTRYIQPLGVGAVLDGSWAKESLEWCMEAMSQLAEETGDSELYAEGMCRGMDSAVSEFHGQVLTAHAMPGCLSRLYDRRRIMKPVEFNRFQTIGSRIGRRARLNRNRGQGERCGMPRFSVN